MGACWNRGDLAVPSSLTPQRMHAWSARLSSCRPKSAYHHPAWPAVLHTKTTASFAHVRLCRLHLVTADTHLLGILCTCNLGLIAAMPPWTCAWKRTKYRGDRAAHNALPLIRAGRSSTLGLSSPRGRGSAWLWFDQCRVLVPGTCFLAVLVGHPRVLTLAAMAASGEVELPPGLRQTVRWDGQHRQD